VVVAGGVALLATSFVPLWATYRVPGLGIVAPQTHHQNAWAAYGLTMQLALVLAAVAAVWAVVMRSPRATTVLLALCAATTALLVWQIVRGPSGSHDPSGYGIERGILVFTGGALAAAMTYGSYREWMKPPQRAPVGDDVPRARRPTSLGE
jgi:hypothetical protein